MKKGTSDDFDWLTLESEDLNSGLFIENSNKGLSTSVKTLLILACTLLVIILFKVFIISNTVVSGISMEPTFQDGNHLSIDKIGYKLKGLKRGDVIVFKTSNGSDFIKRVIGVEGDEVDYRNNQLYINGNRVNEPYLKAGNGFSKPLTYDFTMKNLTGVSRVPQGKLWVMGDNRQNSNDSRYPEVGFVDKSQVVGKVIFRYYPFNRITSSFNN